MRDKFIKISNDGLMGIAFQIFIVMWKLFGRIDFEWIWVLAPALIRIMLGIVIVLISNNKHIKFDGLFGFAVQIWLIILKFLGKIDFEWVFLLTPILAIILSEILFLLVDYFVISDRRK